MAKVCKWAGDAADEYCKGCNGCTMLVEGKEIACTNCAGYEEGAEEAGVQESGTPEAMNPPQDTTPVPESIPPVVETNNKIEPENNEKSNTTTNTPESKKPSKSGTKSKEVAVKVQEETKCEEAKSFDASGVMVTAMRYTSGATVKKGDNYYKFVAEEEWSTTLTNPQELDLVREKLWSKLNSQIDGQIEQISNM